MFFSRKSKKEEKLVITGWHVDFPNIDTPEVAEAITEATRQVIVERITESILDSMVDMVTGDDTNEFSMIRVKYMKDFQPLAKVLARKLYKQKYDKVSPKETHN